MARKKDEVVVVTAPEGGEGDDPELQNLADVPEITEADVPAEEAPATAIAEEAAPTTDRRPIDLTSLPEFRKWQAERDREHEELRRKLAEAERQRREEQQRLEMLARQKEAAELEARLNQAYDDTERQQLIEQLAAIKGYEYYTQWQQWEDFKRKRIAEAGLDPQDSRFQKTYRSVQELEADVLAAERDRLKEEATQLRRKLEETDVEALVAKKVQQALAAAGLTLTDLGEENKRSRADRSALERDQEALQRGLLDPETYLKRWGRR